MFSNKKGQFKYLKKQPIRVGILTIILLLMCASVFMIGFITRGTSKNIFTVVAAWNASCCQTYRFFYYVP